MTKFIIEETKESFNTIHELRQHALFEGISDYTLVVKSDEEFYRDRKSKEDPTCENSADT